VSQSPQTRVTLIARLKDTQDQEAWREFTAIYEPLVFGVARESGLQEADARDVCQQVLEAVSKDVERWQPDGKEASFRRWLFRIARHRVLKLLEQQSRRGVGKGGTTAQAAIEAVADAREDLSAVLERKYREQLLLKAAELIRSEFKETTWQAFWRTCIEGQPITKVAADLGLSLGSVYVARSRIISRLQEKVQAMEGK
jgi:RNA polymerase sigma-70 factor (ECF subfamily)